MIKTTIGVEGMMCHKCEAHVNEALERDFDIKKVESFHEENKTEIISEKELDEEELKRAINIVGYKKTDANGTVTEKIPYDTDRTDGTGETFCRSPGWCKPPAFPRGSCPG